MLINILKSFFNKFNAFVQWTKKWHLLHCTFIFNMIFVSICLLTTINKSPEELLLDTLYGDLLYIYPFSIFIGALLALIIAFIKFIKKQPLGIESKFLLYNKIYNAIFVSNLLYFFSIIVILTLLLFWPNLDELNEMDNLMAAGLFFWLTIVILAILIIIPTVYATTLAVLIKIQKYLYNKK